MRMFKSMQFLFIFFPDIIFDIFVPTHNLIHNIIFENIGKDLPLISAYCSFTSSAKKNKF